MTAPTDGPDDVDVTEHFRFRTADLAQFTMFLAALMAASEIVCCEGTLAISRCQEHGEIELEFEHVVGCGRAASNERRN